MDVALASVRDAANLVTYYVGNKSDLDHDNTDENKEMVEEEQDSNFIETSALKGDGVQELFKGLAGKISEI